MSLNKVMLIGNVGKSPEVKYFGDERNYKVARFSLATDERYKDKEGKVREFTSWHNIVAWNATADYVEKYVKKGMQLYVEGTLRYRTWTDANGVERSSCDISALEIRFLGGGTSGSGSESGESGTARSGEAKTGGGAIDLTATDGQLPDDGLPF